MINSCPPILKILTFRWHETSRENAYAFVAMVIANPYRQRSNDYRILYWKHLIILKQSATIFLQAVIVLIGLVALAILIRLPLIEGRAENLDLFSIYFDPFIFYGYAASVAFFVSLYKGFKLLGYIAQNKVFSTNSVRAIKSIRHCAIVLSILIVTGGLFIGLFHDKEDDPAGFLAICIVTAFVAIAVATAAAVFEKILQNGVDIKSENEQLSGGQKNNLTLKQEN